MSGIEVEVISHVVEVTPGFGPAGPTGPGVPVGGATGQVLAKASATNFDTQWVDPEAAAAGDHGALAGLADDDHPQYHTDARGDARYDTLGAATGAVSAHAAAPGAHAISGVDGLAAALALLAPLASPALTGTPTAPTALAGTASTQLATTAFVAAAIAALLNSALGDDPNFASTVTNALAGKAAKAANLSDLTNAAAALTNLGAGAVGAAVFQAATAAAIRTVLELGGAALLNIGTSAGTAAAGDHSHAGLTTQDTATWQGGVGTVESVVSPAKIAAAIAAIAGSASGTKTLARFRPRDNDPPSSAFATIDTRNGLATLNFVDAAVSSAIFHGSIPEGANLASGIDVIVSGMALSATTGAARIRVAFERGSTDLDVDSFDTAAEGNLNVSATSGQEATVTIRCTAIDGLQAGDRFRCQLSRVGNDATNDTLSDTWQLRHVELRQVA
jgi:hypothetical protein